MNTLTLVAIMVLVLNPLIIRLVLGRFISPEVWNGEFDIILDDGRVIECSFRNDYGIDGIDIPKGRVVEKIILKVTVPGFVPLILLTGKLSTQLIAEYPTNHGRNDLTYQIINPKKLPPMFSIDVFSNQRIIGGSSRSITGIFSSPNNGINIWYDKPSLVCDEQHI